MIIIISHCRTRSTCKSQSLTASNQHKSIRDILRNQERIIHETRKELEERRRLLLEERAAARSIKQEKPKVKRRETCIVVERVAPAIKTESSEPSKEESSTKSQQEPQAKQISPADRDTKERRRFSFPVAQMNENNRQSISLTPNTKKRVENWLNGLAAVQKRR